MLCCAMLCYAMLCYAMLCYAVLCCAVLCCALLCLVLIGVLLCCVTLCCIPGHALHEESLQRQLGDGTLFSNQKRRAAFVLRIKRLPTGRQPVVVFLHRFTWGFVCSCFQRHAQGGCLLPSGGYEGRFSPGRTDPSASLSRPAPPRCPAVRRSVLTRPWYVLVSGSTGYVIPGHPWDEKSLQRQKRRRSTSGHPGSKSASRPADKPRINRLSTADFVPAFGLHRIPGHALHEKGLQRRIGVGTLVSSQERGAPAVLLINRG